MSKPNYELPPYNLFAPPDVITLSAAALDMARDFVGAGRRAITGRDWIATFEWCHERKYRIGRDSDWIDAGAGVDLGAFDRADLPAGVVQTIDGVEVAVKIPSDVWQGSGKMTIDVDRNVFGNLVLR